MSYTLTMEEPHEGATQIRDTWSNEYLVLTQAEINALQLKGRHVDVYEPKSMARPSMSAYGREIVAPTRPIDRLQAILGEPPAIHPLRESMGTINPMTRPLRPVTLHPTLVERNPGGTYGSSAISMPRIESKSRRPPRRAANKGRKVRPSALQKLVKKYDGSGDPFDHVATFKQVVHAEQVSDIHTQVEGFVLTLESKALTWF